MIVFYPVPEPYKSGDPEPPVADSILCVPLDHEIIKFTHPPLGFMPPLMLQVLLWDLLILVLSKPVQAHWHYQLDLDMVLPPLLLWPLPSLMMVVVRVPLVDLRER